MSSRRRVVVLGGGMAGLTAAWQLSRPGWRDELESITVYQRGGRLGGKGASSRGVHDRIEEHGLHVWMGYYENAFRLMRDVYGQLDRPVTDPGCPIRTIDDAFLPAGRLGVGDYHGGEWSHWVAEVPPAGAPPEGSSTNGPATVSDVVRRAARLLPALLAPPPPTPASRPTGVFLTGSPLRPGAPDDQPPLASLAGLRGLLRQAELAALVAGVEGLAAISRTANADQSPAVAAVLSQLDELRASLSHRLRRHTSGRRLLQLADLGAGCIQGAVADRLLEGDGFSKIDHLDFREWLSDRVDPTTLDSPFIRGLYDLVFAYEGGRRDRPRFSAGLGLFLAGRLFFEYEGSIFWKMRAGMGEVVFAPLYQALQARGVAIQLYHRVDELVLDDDATTVTSIRLGRQPAPADADPLLPIKGLPCFRASQPGGDAPWTTDPESLWCDRANETQVELRAGIDFDVAVLAVSLGMVPWIAPALVARQPPWQRMIDGVGTVATQALQVWLRSPERALGWEHPGATVSGYEPPFDTYASMSHLVPLEGWPDGDEPGTIGYFCGALADEDCPDPASADAAAHRHTDRFLAEQVQVFWPEAVDPGGALRRDALCGDEAASIYVRANTDPSDRYVQSLPGSGALRLRADESGVDNLVLAGDWTRCGLDAGCIEAAVMSGIQAANVVTGRPITEGLVGRWMGLESRVEEPVDARA